MARLTDFSEGERKHHLDKIRDLPDFGLTPFVPGPPLLERRVAIVTTSGVHARGDRPFDIGAADYRVIPGDTPAADLLMSHVSVNFDRSGFQEDINVVFPVDRLKELKADGVIGSVSDTTILSWAPRRSALSSPRLVSLRPCSRKIALTRCC